MIKRGSLILFKAPFVREKMISFHMPQTIENTFDIIMVVIKSIDVTY